MRLSRRDFLKVAGITAAGIAIPSEETLRRFWPGWSPAAAAAPPAIDILGPAFNFSSLLPYDTVFVLTDRATGRGEFAWWTGDRLVRRIGAPYGRIEPGFSPSPDGSSRASGFPVIDAGWVPAPMPHEATASEVGDKMESVVVGAMTPVPTAWGGRLLP